MLFSTPALSVNTYVAEPTSYEYGLELIKTLDIATAGGK